MNKTCNNCIYRLFDDKNEKYYYDLDPDFDIYGIISCTGFESKGDEYDS